MSGHPSLDDLVALAEALHADDSLPEAGSEALAHCAGCPRCDVALQRLRAGLGILAEARAHRPEAPDWEAMDAVMAQAAEESARKIRAGALRPVSRWRDPVAVGFGFAVAAAALFALRFVPREGAGEGSSAVAQGPSQVPEVSPGGATSQARYEAAVLLSAGGARVERAPGAGLVPMASAGTLSEGARIETAAAGRSVLSLARGWRADVRSGSTVALAALRDDATVLRVAAGSVALAPSEEAPGEVQIVAGRWTLQVAGQVVGTYSQSVLRVVVLSGRVRAAAGDGESLQMVGPVVFDLPAVGPGARRIETALDPEALAPGLFAADGVWLRVPPLEDGARVTLGETGALPAALEALRVHTPATLVARTARGRMTLVLDGTEGLAWRPSPTLAHAVPAIPRTARPPRASTVDLGGPVVAPVPEEPALTAAQHRAMLGQARPRLAHCLATCQERNRCPERLQGAVELSVSPDGRTTVAQLDPSLEGARACLAHEARFLHFPGRSQPYGIALEMATPTP